jgi:formylglycine-generating enzyme required for sulfatase activity
MMHTNRWQFAVIAAAVMTVSLLPARVAVTAIKRRPSDGGAVMQPASAGTRDMVLVPAGSFIMGSNKTDASMADQYTANKPFYDNEHPRHKQTLAAFYIDKYEVTNSQYRRFVLATDHRPPYFWVLNGYLLSMTSDKVKALDVGKMRHLAARVFKLDMDTRKMTKDQLLDAFDQRYAYLDKLPVVYVTWYDARDYCTWAGKRLPAEAEWEKAARGTDGNEFPWGDTWKPGLSNTGEEYWDDGVAPVGSYKTDKSPYGVYDMAGNVSEWVQDWYEPYPGSDYHSADFGKKYKVMRGAAWGREGHYQLTEFQRSGYRSYIEPASAHSDLGFRCAMDAAPAPVVTMQASPHPLLH